MTKMWRDEQPDMKPEVSFAQL